MESTSNEREFESTSEGQAHVEEGPSIDSSDDLHPDPSQGEEKSPNALKLLTSSTILPEIHIQEPADPIKSISDVLIHGFSVADLNIAENNSEEISEEMDIVSAENIIISSGETESSEVTMPASPEETELVEVTMSTPPGETASTEVTVSTPPGETLSTEVTVSTPPGETGLAEVTVLAAPGETLSEVKMSATPGETGSIKVTELAPPLETESPEVTMSASPEETGLTSRIPSALPQETDSTEIHQPVLPEETKSAEVFQLSSSNIEAKIGSADTELAQTAQNDINPPITEIASKLSSSEDPDEFSRIASKGKAITTMQNLTEEYRKRIYAKRLGCATRVMDNCSPSTKHLSPGAKLTPSLSTKNSTLGLLKPFDTADGSTISQETSSDIPLSASLTILAKWISRCLEKISKYSDTDNFENLKDYAEKEITYQRNVLMALNKRVDSLLKAADSLPDPTYFLSRGQKGQRNSILDNLNDAGKKVKSRLEALEVGATEDYDRFISVSNDIANMKADELDVQMLKEMTCSITINSFVNASENVLILGVEIESFRRKVREFCSEIYKLL